MKCPVCRNHEQYATLEVQTEGFSEEINTCSICGTVWAVNHGAIEVVRDPQEKSFLEAVTECVEGDDYHLAA
ncbi:hypothetical protein [Geobacter sp. DSM 9736]|uniref:hypothetical protein n=1 Tax=Geobacter sp. DSM 9736 TaxID=1277350 RepID=UPI000B501E6E|nr:hypothetical protein [Geobacter sp. DSM 9736]SNB47546.1 hypothetical protein SAMN06269301_3036 [Geobacter sp. DSM 9736]